MRLRQTTIRLPQCLCTSLSRKVFSSTTRWVSNSALRNSQDEAVDVVADSPLELRDGRYRPVHKRQHGKTSLLLPPLMDPSIKAQKERHRAPKPCANPKERTPFQQKLYENPYAQALATPVRTCHITSIHLPSYFHLHFHELLPPASDDASTSETISSSDPTSHSKRPTRTGQTPWLLPVLLNRAAHPTSHPWHMRGKSIRLLARLSMIRYFSPSDAKQAKGRRRRIEPLKLGGMVWRDDMPGLVGQLMGDVVARKLSWPLRHGGRLVEEVRGEGWEEWVRRLQDVEDVGCVLLLVPFCRPEIRYLEKQLDRAASEILRDAERIMDRTREVKMERITHREDGGQESKVIVPTINVRALYPALELPTMVCRQEEVPVYGLPDMLGHEEAKRLVEGTALEGAKCIALKKSHLIKAPQMWLSKLQAYLADDFPIL